MKLAIKQNGFSLTEVLMAAGILSVGLMLIATMFPVAIYLTSIASERTMAAIIADEAFAKIQLYEFGGSLPTGTGDYNNISSLIIDPCEFSYNPAQALANPQYYWSAVYKQLPGNEYQITVFIARKTNAGLMYPYRPDITTAFTYINRPRIIPIQVNCGLGSNQITFTAPANPDDAKYFNPPAAIIDNATGKIYRVIERKINTAGNPEVTIDRKWEDSISPATIWLMPPPTTGGRNADIEVYQRIISF